MLSLSKGSKRCTRTVGRNRRLSRSTSWGFELQYQLHRRASIELLAFRATRSCRDGPHSRSSWGSERLCKGHENDACAVQLRSRSLTFVWCAFFWWLRRPAQPLPPSAWTTLGSNRRRSGEHGSKRDATIHKQRVLSAVSHWLRWIEGGVADRRLAAINGCRWFGRRQPARQLFAVGPPGIIAERTSILTTNQP